MPQVRIQDNLQLPANTYVVRIKEIEVARGDIRPNRLLVMDPSGQPIDLAGTETVEPTFGLPAMWIGPEQREEALFKGYTVVDPSTVVTTHITEVIRDNMADLLSYTETQKLLDELPDQHQKLVSDVIPNQISVGGLQRVLQNLLGERVSIRDLPTILEGVSEASGYTRNATNITEHVRTRLARQISEQHALDDGVIPLVTLSPDWEQAFGSPSSAKVTTASFRCRRATSSSSSRRSGRRSTTSPRSGGSGDADLARHPALCALDHRAVPSADCGNVAERNFIRKPRSAPSVRSKVTDGLSARCLEPNPRG